ncbi:hypothetical protein [Brevibacterium sp. CCUG 69071]|uniref:hypothetical protein n=1 Tax=Brevibacterium sp. CCUG 69071 TaxID=2052937 RepID=UPI001E4615E6|nr:hypothetical protein [Brevibacterium sp. CCUG 69071]
MALDIPRSRATAQVEFLALAGISLAAALPASRLPNCRPDEEIPDPEKQPAG